MWSRKPSWTATDSIKPKYRGTELTVAQFASNYNATLEITRDNPDHSEKLQQDGTWNPAPMGMVVVHVGGEPGEEQPELQFATDAGLIKQITYERSWTQVSYLKPINYVCQNVVYSLLLGQENVGVVELDRIATELDYEVERNSTGSYRFQNIEILWDIQYENCDYVGGILTDLLESDTFDGNGTASLTFQVILH